MRWQRKPAILRPKLSAGIFSSLAEGPSVDRQADLTSLSERAGYGVEAIWQNQRVRLGRPTWVAEIAAGNNLEIKHHGVMFAVENREIIGFTLEDDLRPGAEGHNT